MWGLQIHVAAAAPQNWDSLEPASTSTYWLTSQTVSLGRPAKGQAPSAVDIVVAGDSAVSKVHAVLEVAHGGAQLSVQDLSRYGTFVNGEKLASESKRQLQPGDNLKLAAKVHARVLHRPLRICACPNTELSPTGQQVVSTCGVHVVQHWEQGVTHVLASHGQRACSILVRALLAGVPLITSEWLDKLSEQKVWVGGLPLEGSCQPSTLSLPTPSAAGLDAGAGAAPGSAWVERPVSQCLSATSHNGNALLSGFTIHFVNGFQDDTLAYCLRALGALMPQGPPRAAPQAATDRTNGVAEGTSGGGTVCVSTAAQAVFEAGEEGGEGDVLLPHLPVSELLACLLSADISLLRQRVLNTALMAAARARKTAELNARAQPQPSSLNHNSQHQAGGPSRLQKRLAQARQQQQPVRPQEEQEVMELEDDLTEEEEDVEVLPASARSPAHAPPGLNGTGRGARHARVRGASGQEGEEARVQVGDDDRANKRLHSNAAAGPSAVAAAAAPSALLQLDPSHGSRGGSGGQEQPGATRAGTSRAATPSGAAGGGAGAVSSGAGFKQRTRRAGAAVRVGPGHAVMYQPLVVVQAQHRPGAGGTEAGGGCQLAQWSGPNFKCFRKAGVAGLVTDGGGAGAAAGTPTEPGLSQGGRQALALVKEHFQPPVDATAQQHEEQLASRKRKTDDELFETAPAKVARRR